jgi:hypothetical protein
MSKNKYPQIVQLDYSNSADLFSLGHYVVLLLTDGTSQKEKERNAQLQQMKDAAGKLGGDSDTQLAWVCMVETI